MKKTLLLAMAAFMMVALCACGGSGESSGDNGGLGGATASFTAQTHRIAAGSSACAVLLDDGTVSCSLDTSADRYVHVSDEWKSWTDVADISMNEEVLAAVKSDGTVVWCGGREEYDWLHDASYMSAVDEWKDVVQVSASHTGIAALKSDGAIEAIGSIQTKDLAETSGFTQVSLYDALLGLREDGTVYCFAPTPYDGQEWSYDVSGWSGIVQVSAGFDHAVALKSDGTVVATGNNSCGQCNVGEWTDIAQVCAGREFTMGLKSNGTVVVAGAPEGGGSFKGIEGWSDIKEISAMFDQAMGLKADGTVLYSSMFGYSNPSATSTKIRS